MKLEVYSDASHKQITKKFEVASCGAFVRFTGNNFQTYRLFGGYLPYCIGISGIESAGISYVLNQLNCLKYDTVEIYSDDKRLNDMLIHGNFVMSNSIRTMLTSIQNLDCNRVKILNHRRNNTFEASIAHSIAYNLIKRFKSKEDKIEILKFNRDQIKEELSKLGLTYSGRIDNISIVRNAYNNF